MPTGGGKSVTFQVPALCKDGVCIVITPLIALMKDQVDNLRKRYIQAAAVYSGMSHDEVLKTLENCVNGNTKILYVSPERLGSELFQAKLRHMRVSFITVDEAHCISQWGYDFRPSYLQIANIRKIKPHAPILALTATATPAVVKDIQLQLAFRQENVFRMSFARKNIAYIVRNTYDKVEQLLHILRAVEGCAIVYVHSRKRTNELVTLLHSENITALAYHAGLDSDTRYNDAITVALRTSRGLDLQALSPKHRTYCLENAQRYLDDGLLERTQDNRLRLTRRGLFVSDMIMSNLIYLP